MSVSYAKLNDGTWGVRGPGLEPGAAVTVVKRDGTAKTETVGRVVWSGQGVQLATIAPKPAARGRASRGRRTGCYCGSREDEPQDSDCWQCRHDNE